MEYKLGDICFIQSGGTPKRSNKKFYSPAFIPWVKIGDLGENEVIFKTEESLSEDGLIAINNRIFPKGTILLALYGATLGKTGIAGIELTSNQAILGINTLDDKILLNQYLKYWLDFNVKKFQFEGKGGTYKNLSKKYISNLKISIPSIDVQRIAVQKINKIINLLDKRQLTIDLLDEYLESLFVHTFLENSMSKNWQILPISDIVKSSTYGTSKKANLEKRGMPILRMNNITYKGELNLEKLKWVEYTASEKNKYKLSNGDVLFNRTNSKELVGKTAVWDRGEGFTYAGYLVKFVLNFEIVNPYYFSSFLNSNFGKKILYHKARPSGNMVNFSPPLLKKENILVPPIELQNEFENSYKKIKIHKQKLLKSRILIEELLQAFIYQTFFLQEKLKVKDEISTLLYDNVQLELFLNTFNASDFQSIDQYNIEVEKLFKILEKTNLRIKENEEFRNGIIQLKKGNKVELIARKDYLNQIINETKES